MSENLDQNQPIESEKTPEALAQEYLDYYLEIIGAPEFSAIAPYDKRIMADVPLMVQLEPLSLPETPPDAEEQPKARERYLRVKYFQENNRLPTTEREATIASSLGLDETIYRAKRAKDGLRGKGLLATLSSVKGFHSRAAISYGALASLREPNESLEIHPNIDKLRTNREALYVIGDALKSREFLDRNDWITGRDGREKYWRGFVLFAAEYASDEVLADVYENILVKERNNRDYWAPLLEYAEKQLGHLVVGEEHSTKLEQPGDVPDEPAAPTKSFSEQIPRDERVDYSDEQYKIETLIRQSYSVHAAELEVLGARAIRDKSGNIIGIEPKDEQLSTEKQVRSGKPSKKRNPANSPWIRRQPGYDKRPDK